MVEVKPDKTVHILVVLPCADIKVALRGFSRTIVDDPRFCYLFVTGNVIDKNSTPTLVVDINS